MGWAEGTIIVSRVPSVKKAYIAPCRKFPVLSGEPSMIITTTESIPGHEFEVLGLVVGNTVQAKNIGRDILSGLKSMVGGEITAYTEMLSEAREIALDRMEKEAGKLGANAVIGLRFSTAETMPGAAELMAYGTAVKLR
jgi:uncharacterized protein YbjQ (UPF0145 family)